LHNLPRSLELQVIDIVHASAARETESAARPAGPHNWLFARLTRWRLVIGTQILDVAIIAAAALLLYPLASGGLQPIPPRYFYAAAGTALICHFMFLEGRLYDIEALLEETRAIRSIMLRWSLVFTGLLAAAGVTQDVAQFSRLWLAAFYVLGFLALAGDRLCVALLIRRWIARGYSTKTVVVVGDNALAGQLIARLAQSPSGIRVAGVFDDRVMAGGFLLGVPKLGNIDDLLEYTNRHVIDLVVLTLPLTATARINKVVKTLRQQPLTIRLLPGPIGLDRISPIRLSRADLPGVQLITVSDRPISEAALLVKGALDRCLAAAALVVFAPVLLLCAAGIALSGPGPVLFRQKRIGYKGREFKIIKFRTMYAGAFQTPHATDWQDRRVFAFGRLLRRTSFDELPQLINVLKGEMSLVGPRPHMVGQMVEGRPIFEAVNEYAGRHRVKPGITGWAQVNGWRGPTHTLAQIERRVEHDIYYIENWSLMLDAVILIKTIFVGFFGKNVF
jgi:Undecaprenyl-phosphate glucose phosphotransferase